MLLAALAGSMCLVAYGLVVKNWEGLLSSGGDLGDPEPPAEWVGPAIIVLPFASIIGPLVVWLWPGRLGLSPGKSLLGPSTSTL